MRQTPHPVSVHRSSNRCAVERARFDQVPLVIHELRRTTSPSETSPRMKECRALLSPRMSRVGRGMQYLAEWWLRLPWPPPVRVWWLRRFGASVGSRTRVHRCSFLNLEVVGFRNLVLGADVHVGPETMFDLADIIEIGDRSTTSPRVTIVTHSDPGAARLQRRRSHAPVVIEADCWIGTNATILEGVRVGARSVVGANALVRAHVPAGSVVVGVPARAVSATHHPISPPQ